MRRLILIFAISAGCAATNAAAEPEKVLDSPRTYVDPHGSDVWSGRLEHPNADGSDGPVATIGAARDRMRALRKEHTFRGTAEVIVAPGVYRIESALEFTPEDSGTAETPVTYRGAGDAVPAISGGLPISGWQREGDLWVADVSQFLANHAPFSSLWVNGERRQRARTPNPVHAWGDYPEDSDTFFMESPVEETNPADGSTSRSATKFVFRAGNVLDRPDIDGAIFVIYHSWETSLIRVKSLDTANRVVEFTGGARWAFGQWQPDQRYYVENIRAALDQPGEWYLDRSAAKLHYWPMERENPDSAEVIAPIANQLIVLRGDPKSSRFVEHLRFENLAFEHTEFPIALEGHSDAQAAYSVNAAVETTGTRHCEFVRCAVRHVANYGVWFRAGSQHNALRQAELSDLGAGGVRIGEGGDPATPEEAAGHNIVDNCLIREGGRTFRGAVGVWIGRSSYNEITHNEIDHFRYTGVSVGWSWGYAESSANHNRIELNHIHDIGLGQLNDMGGIYTLGISPGTALIGNVIHDVSSHPRLYGGWGLYTDEGSSHILLQNNLVYNTRTGGFHQHYGRDNWVVNNILAYSAGPQVVRSREEDHTSFLFERNIVLFDNGQLLGSTWKNGNWIMDNNVYWDTSGAPYEFSGRSFDGWRAEGHDEQSVIADPKFENAAAHDFHLPDDSPALGVGFQPFDYARAGLYGDPAWVARAGERR